VVRLPPRLAELRAVDVDARFVFVRLGRLADVPAAFFAGPRFAVTPRAFAGFEGRLFLAGAGVDIASESFAADVARRSAPRSVDTAPDTALVNALVSASTPPAAAPIAPPTRSAVWTRMPSFSSSLFSGAFGMVEHLSAKPGLCDSIEVKYVMVLSIVTQLACAGGAEQRADGRVTTWRSAGSWSGRGSAQLATFPTGGGPLRIHWETRNESPAGAGRFTLRLHSADSGRVLAEVVDQKGESVSSKDIADDHQRFYLTVDSASVEWTIRVDEAITRSQ
jgi:hypothetical protein